MTKDEYIDKLKNQINRDYNLNIDRIKASSRGADGETWIIYSGRKKYFVKIAYYISHKKRYINSINTLNLLNKHNIKNINRIINTVLGKKYIDFNGGLLAVYSFVNGSIDYNYSYDKIIKLLVPIYKIEDDLSSFAHEDFNISSLIDEFNKSIELSKKNNDCNNIVSKYNELLSSYVNKLEYYYSKINKDNKMFITHGDACVNVMATKNKDFLIDWDDTLVAPIERDCWFFADYPQKISYINEYLKNNKIDYTLSYDLLAYYAYKSVLEYLNVAISKYFETNNKDLLDEVEVILNGWVRNKIKLISEQLQS